MDIYLRIYYLAHFNRLVLQSSLLGQDESSEDGDELPTMAPPVMLDSSEMDYSHPYCDEEQSRDSSLLSYERAMPSYGITFSKVSH